MGYDKCPIMKPRILWIKGDRAAATTFLPDLRKKGYHLETVPSGKCALALLSSFHPDLTVVHAASMRSNGQRICCALRGRMNGEPILLIQRKDQHSLTKCQANQVLVLPFTIRKLVNRIQALVPEANGKALHAGPIALYPDCRTLQVAGGEAQKLTPNLVALLHILINNRGVVMEREVLFREVWKTDYVEDTRTLDVHISWLRKKIESDPRRPALLKTVRGVGYRLDA